MSENMKAFLGLQQLVSVPKPDKIVVQNLRQFLVEFEEALCKGTGPRKISLTYCGIKIEVNEHLPEGTAVIKDQYGEIIQVLTNIGK